MYSWRSVFAVAGVRFLRDEPHAFPEMSSTSAGIIEQ
jgi:hypothetical protein